MRPAHRRMKRGVRLGFCAEAVARQHYDKGLRGLANDELAKGRTAVLFGALHPDAVAGLKITALRSQPARRRGLRRALLWATRGFHRTPDVVLGAVAIGDRLAPNRLQGAYSFALDYFYALGAEQEQRAQRAEPAHATRAA